MVLLAVNFDNLHQILQSLYVDMMPLCSQMTGVAKGLAGLGALFYVAYRVWQSLARAEPIDVFPLLRPFALGLCIMFFPTLVLGTLNSVMSPIVTGTHRILETQTFDMNEYRRQKDKLEFEAMKRNPETAYLVDKESFDNKLDELGALDAIEACGMYVDRAMYNMKKCTAPQKLDTFGVFFMKYNYEIRLKAVKLVLEGGLSVREAGCHLGCGRSQVHLWVTLFERHGLAGLKLRHGSYSAEFKLSVLKHMHQNHLSLLETAVHFGIPGPFVIRQWERLYQNQGAEGLRRKPQRRRPAMSKSKTKKVKLKTTPHEELLKELEYLRAENAYLKKLQALVEERIVRESGKEPKPSKD